MFARLAGFLLLLLTFGAWRVNADSIYQITGSMTIPGNSANPGVSETINFSFELFYPEPVVRGFPIVVGTPVVTSVGPLGDFTMNTAGVPGNTVSGYIGFFNPPIGAASTTYPEVYAEIDLPGDFLVAPSISGWTWFYICRNPNIPCSEFTSTAPGNEYPDTATATIYKVQTPEPGTLCLSVLGVLAFCLMKKTLTH